MNTRALPRTRTRDFGGINPSGYLAVPPFPHWWRDSNPRDHPQRMVPSPNMVHQLPNDYLPAAHGISEVTRFERGYPEARRWEPSKLHRRPIRTGWFGLGQNFCHLNYTNYQQQRGHHGRALQCPIKDLNPGPPRYQRGEPRGRCSNLTELIELPLCEGTNRPTPRDCVYTPAADLSASCALAHPSALRELNSLLPVPVTRRARFTPSAVD